MATKKTTGKRATGTSTAKGKRSLKVVEQSSGRTCPAGGASGGIMYWDGFNWVVLPPPTTPGAVLTWGQDGPFWANPG